MATQSRPLHLLLTRPRAQGVRFARQLRARLSQPFHIVHAPLMAPVFLRPSLPQGGYGAAIFTSETGVAAVAGAHALPKLAYCVGDQTARAARRAGFTALSATGDVEALLQMIMQRPPGLPLLHLCGAETRGDLAQRLSAAGIETHKLIVYRQVPLALPSRVRKLLLQDVPLIVPLFSPRTAQHFLRAAEPTSMAQIYFAAISHGVADVVLHAASARVIVASAPTSEGMIAAIGCLGEGLAAPCSARCP